MRKHFVIALICTILIAACPMDGHGQNSAPEGEFFVGGAKIWTHAPSDHFDTHGWGGSITGYFNNYIGVEADLFEYNDIPENPPAYSTHYTFLFGPHFAYHGNSRITPFAHVLVGGTRGTQYIPYPYPPGAG